VSSSADSLDTLDFELVRNTIATLLDEMSLTLMRTARSNNVRDAMDFAAGLCDPDGRLIGQGISIPGLLCAIPSAVEAVLARFGDDLQPGDVYALNDPYSGGTHLSDIFVFKPLFNDGVPVAILAIVADHVDVGGRVPGSRALDSTEIYEEGLRLPPVRLLARGKWVAPIWNIISANVRLPATVVGDLEACLAAFESAEASFAEAIERYGVAALRIYYRQSLDYSRRLAESAIAGLPDGRYEFTDHMDDSITGPDPVVFHVVAEVSGARIRFDFSGSADAVKAAINCPLSSTKSVTYAAVMTLMPPELPVNAGLFDAIEITGQPGNLLWAVHPAPVAQRGAAMSCVFDTVMGVLAQIAPDRMPAAGEGGNFSVRITGTDAAGKPWVLFDSVIGTRGARPGKDGIDGCAGVVANLSNVPVEAIEAEYPVRIRQYGLRPGSGGPGRFRGGLGLVREWEILAERAVMTGRGERARFAPWGINGGGDGEKMRNLLVSGETVSELPAKFRVELQRGDRVVHNQASGGGNGDPRERDPELVLADLRNEKVSPEAAANNYGSELRSHPSS
jgi:N-methylhydantoinase B